jgi:hypothetical protein
MKFENVVKAEKQRHSGSDCVRDWYVGATVQWQNEASTHP